MWINWTYISGVHIARILVSADLFLKSTGCTVMNWVIFWQSIACKVPHFSC